MKMVKTFIKTQHQHVMPPEKGKRKVKENVQSKLIGPITSQSDGRSRSHPQFQNGPEDGEKEVRTAFSTKHNTTHHLCVFP